MCNVIRISITSFPEVMANRLRYGSAPLLYKERARIIGVLRRNVNAIKY